MNVTAAKINTRFLNDYKMKLIKKFTMHCDCSKLFDPKTIECLKVFDLENYEIFRVQTETLLFLLYEKLSIVKFFTISSFLVDMA